MFKPNLCSEPNGPINFPKLVSVKLDGIRCVTKFGNALSRSLKPIPNHYIREMLSKYQGLDGEIIVGPANAPDVYRTTNSAVMSRDGEPKDFTFYVFDDLDAERFQPLEKRLEVLRARDLPDFIKVLPQRTVTTQEALDVMYSEALDDGFEGLIARNANSAYKFGRATAASQDALKCKPWKDSEARIISVYEALENQNEEFTDELGRTKRSSHQENKVGKGMIGGFVCRDIHSGVEFNCAPGRMKHDERVALFGKALEGGLLKYRYMAVGVKDKPRFPRYIGWRNEIDL
jgi:DNA ligase-1